MKISKLTYFYFMVIGLALALLAPLPVCGQQPFQTTEIVYRPPVDTMPIRRIGAASRGGCKQNGIDDSFSLQVLAPDSIGQTTSEQPTLYWSVSESVSGQFTFTVMEDSRSVVEPVLEVTMDLSIPAGIQPLPLAEYHVTLKQGVVYKWSVSLECDAENPSKNFVTTGLIKQVDPVAALEKSIRQAKLEKLPYLYAISGYWYDALSSLSELIQKHPTDKRWREVLTNLLKQGGVGKIAALNK